MTCPVDTHEWDVERGIFSTKVLCSVCGYIYQPEAMLHDLMPRRFAASRWIGATALYEAIVDRLHGRMGMNQRNAAIHPDPERRAISTAKAEAYRVAIEDLSTIYLDQHPSSSEKEKNDE
jgi:hypothetical protein